MMFLAVSCSQNLNTTENLKQEKDGKFRSHVIYGEDNRKDYYNSSEDLRALADSTVALVKAVDINEISDGVFSLDVNSYSKNFNLCKSEAFYDQVTGAFCSGSLIAPDVILTAGHCIKSAYSCEGTKFVFGFNLKQESVITTQFPQSDVYSCREVIHTQVDHSNGSDFALIRLDRKVEGRTPLFVEHDVPSVKGDDILVIGHPMGLPTKIADGAKVRSDKGAYFNANLDTYGGNSGSAVFNTHTKNIVGVLVRGENDMVYKDGCNISNQCPDGGCRGEDVTHIGQIFEYINLPRREAPPSDDPVDEYLRTEEETVPDNNIVGIESIISADSAPNGRKIEVLIDISHSWIADLELILISPSGIKAFLHKRGRAGTRDIRGVYGQDLRSFEKLGKFSNEVETGDWKLVVRDRLARDVGILHSWGLRFK